MTDAIGYEAELGAADGRGPYNVESGTSRAPRNETDFASALSAWREVELPALQANLGTVTPTLIDAQKEALLSRKKLAEQTREFKKLTPEEQPEQVKPLLKAYQTEIDSLTKRAKAAESAVLTVHDRLQGVSDPYPLLELLVEQTAAVADAEALRSQLETLRAKSSSLEQQLTALPTLEADKKRLTERLTALEASSERRLAEARKAFEAEFAAKYDERARNQTAREEGLAKTLEATQGQLQELRANYSKATERLLSHGEEIDRGDSSGKIEELDFISEELARSNDRAAAAERRNEQLRQEIEQLKSNAGEDERLREAEERVLDAQEESQRLARLLENAGEQAQQDVKRQADRVAERDAQLREKTEEINALRTRLQRMSDYEEVKRELGIFKFVEFSIDADRGADEEDETALHNGANGGASSKPLEALLIEKNRAVQDELTSLRVKHQELVETSRASQDELERSRTDLERVYKLNARLEEDLMNMRPGSTLGAGKSDMSAEDALAEMGKIASDSAGQGSASSDGKQGATKSTGSNAVPHNKAMPAAAASGTASPGQQPSGSGSSASSILPIITSQRDRFRARNAELEEELRKQFATITELRNEVKTLQSDNLGLYEKMRYLQTYNGAAGSSSGGSSIRAPLGGSRVVNMAAARTDAGAYPPSSPAARAEAKYRDRYEASMNPFEQFRGHEQNRALQSLNPLERLLHMATRLVLGHRRMRIFFVVYALSLHLLVFAMLFEVEFGYMSNSSVGTGRTPA